MPGPWSRTVSSPSRSRTSTAPPADSTWRRCRAGWRPRGRAAPRSPSPRTAPGRSSKVTCWRVAPGALDRGRHELVEPQRLGGSPAGSPSRASSTRSPTSSASSSSCATRSRRRRSRSAAGRSRRVPSTSRLVRSEVSGVRSSCDASATSWRCARWESSSASSIVLNDAARRASSSSPCASMRRDRSRVRATCSAVSVSSVDRSHGVRGWRSGRGTRPARCRRARRRPRPRRSRESARRPRQRARELHRGAVRRALVKTRTCTPSTCSRRRTARAARRRPPATSLGIAEPLLSRPAGEALRSPLRARSAMKSTGAARAARRPATRTRRQPGALNRGAAGRHAARSDASICPRSVSRTTA